MDQRERDFKTNIRHWSLIVEYFETYPEMVKKTFMHQSEDNKDIKLLWKDLVGRLNSLGHGEKSLEKWQQAIARWKSKVKSKAAAFKNEQLKTGGGRSSAPPLNDVEERLMNIYGWRSITGDNNTEFGFIKGKENVEVEIEVPPLVPLRQLPPAQPSPLPDPAPSPLPAPAPSSPPPMATASTSMKRKRECKKTPQTPKTKKIASIYRMHSEQLEVLKTINNNFNTISSAMTEMKNDFKRLVDHLILKD